MKKSSTHPLISVIMAVYNGMPYLEEAVSSILNQTYKNLEFIIVDDASTDGSFNYLKTLKDKRIKLIQNKKNLGLAASLNVALKRAQGEFIARMDADDISTPNRLKVQQMYLNDHPGISLCGCWVNLVDATGKVIGEKRYPTSDRKIKNALKWYQPIVHPTFMARRQLFEQLNGYNERFDYAEDYELLVRAIKKYKFTNIPQKLLYWRFADERRSRKYMKKIDQADFKVKLEILKNNYYGRDYAFCVAKKFITAFLFPIALKIYIAKKINLA